MFEPWTLPIPGASQLAKGATVPYSRPGPEGRPASPGIRRPRTAIAAAIGAAIVLAILAVASARGASTVTARINTQPSITSVTVSVSDVTLSGCTGGTSTPSTLGFPNGTCASQQFTVTNGTAPSHIKVVGSNAIPADNGLQWSLAQTQTPGADEFAMFAVRDLSGVIGVRLATTPLCDVAFYGAPAACQANQTAAPGQAGNESLAITGPATSTDPSATFTTGVTWVAS